MPDNTGRIRAKQLDQTGFTEDMLARAWSAGPNRSSLAIIELRTVEPHGPNAEGKKRIDYVIDGIEPVPEALEERAREFMRALYAQRPEQEGQAVLSGTTTDASTADAAMADLDATVERDGDNNVIGIWTGLPETPPTGDAGSDDADTAAGPTWTTCDYPGCTLPAEHDGDHDVAEGE